MSADRADRYAQQALETAVAIIDASIPGNRHHARLKAGELLGGYVAGGILSYDQAYTVLEAAVNRNTDDPPRSLKTIADALSHGQGRAITLADLEAEREVWLAQRHPSPNGYSDNAPSVSDPWDGTITLPVRPYRGRYYPRPGREVSHG